MTENYPKHCADCAHVLVHRDKDSNGVFGTVGYSCIWFGEFHKSPCKMYDKSNGLPWIVQIEGKVDL